VPPQLTARPSLLFEFAVIASLNRYTAFRFAQSNIVDLLPSVLGAFALVLRASDFLTRVLDKRFVAVARNSVDYRSPNISRVAVKAVEKAGHTGLAEGPR